jgi:hypothetical protein
MMAGMGSGMTRNWRGVLSSRGDCNSILCRHVVMWRDEHPPQEVSSWTIGFFLQ